MWISFSNFGAWLWLSEVLNKFALHYKTNESIPMSFGGAIDEASTFNEDSQVETIASSLMV
jgi:peptidyl-dipeptidase Dcp